MKKSPVRMAQFIFILSFLMVAVACVPPDPTENQGTIDDKCDRECLLSVLDNYLEALAANDPSQIDVADNLKYTDNGVAAKLGQGLWTTAAGLDNEKRLDFADPVQMNVATQVVLNERVEDSSEKGADGDAGGCDGSTANELKPIIYQVRLKVEQNVITEIESMTLTRASAFGIFNVKNMKPESVFTESIPEDQRMSRDELIALMDLYVDYLDGDVTGKDVPFDENCKRYENGVITAPGLTAFNLQSWFFNVTRRYPVVDEKAGIVWGMLPFSQTDTSLVVGEAFKMFDGKIKMIQAVMCAMPAKAWD